LRAASEDRSSGEVGRTSEASVASAGASVGNSLGASSTSVVVATIESALRDISAAREDVIATQFLSAKEARVASANTSVDGGVLGAGSIEVSVAAEQRAFVKISTSTKDIGAGKDLSSIVSSGTSASTLIESRALAAGGRRVSATTIDNAFVNINATTKRSSSSQGNGSTVAGVASTSSLINS